jgi:GH35 family endo-1,4-beta-xylanase
MGWSGRVALCCVLIWAGLLLQSCGGIVGHTDAPVAQLPLSPQPADTRALFGMDIHSIGAGTPWPSVTALPAWRLWDAHVTWRDLEPSPGVFNFSLLDFYVRVAGQHHTELLLTLAATPQWASQRPTEPAALGPGAAAPPARMQDWDNFVTRVATGYKGRIHAYEILNEPNLTEFFTGTVSDELAMLRDAYQIIKKIDPAAVVVSPSFTRDGVQQLDQLLQMGGAQYMDAVGFHFYFFPGEPETMEPIVDSVAGVLSANNINKPVWDTEIGFGPTQTFTDENQQAAYFARTMLMHWKDHIARAYWYAWDDHNWAHLWMTEPDNKTLTKAGVAFSVLYGWISSASLTECSIGGDTPNECTFNLANGRPAHIVWVNSGEASFAIPSSWQGTSMQDLTGTQSALPQNLTVTESPVLIQ